MSASRYGFAAANEDLADRDLSVFTRWNNLTHVDIIGYSNVTGVGLAHLVGATQLYRLNLHQSGITDATVLHLAKLTSPHMLDLAGTKASAEGIAQLQQALPQCVVFHE